MVSIQSMLSISQCLAEHPVLLERTAYKVKYLNVLEHFVNKYSKHDCYAQAVLENTKNVFLGTEASQYTYNASEIQNAAKAVNGLRFRGFRLFSYRFVLAYDVLFMCAFTDDEKGSRIIKEIKETMHERYHARLDSLYQALYHNGPLPMKTDFVEQRVAMWHKNMRHYFAHPRTILFTATMSAGKSTLINALVGKVVSRTKSDACTAKIHHIISKAYEDGFTSEYDYELTLNADFKALMDDNPDNTSDTISVGTAFCFLDGQTRRLHFIDTPGVNSSLDETHAMMTQKAISANEFDYLVYVMNGNNLGAEDDKKYLENILESIPSAKIFFVINKLDTFDQSTDSIEESIQKVEEDVKKLGFVNYEICPVSAYAGLLGKKALAGMALNEDEADYLSMCLRKYKRSAYDCSKYYPLAEDDYVITAMENLPSEQKRLYSLLVKSGLYGLEHALCK